MEVIMDKTIKKRIKVTSRGMVTTSRGRVRTPIGPYIESVGYISVMIVREKATVVEVLPDGTEVELNIQNFDKDNTKKINAEAGKKVEDPKNDEKAPETPQEPTNRQLSRKERKKQEYEKKVAEAAKNGTPVKVEQNGMIVPQPIYEKDGIKVSGEKTFEELANEQKEATPADTTIPQDAIEN